MSEKTIIMICVLIGSTLGGFVPAIWGASLFSLSSILLSGVGGILGIWVGMKLIKL